MTHLIVVKGEKIGQEFSVPRTGMRVGRSHANDVVYSDDALSQFHCRFFFKSDDTLWVTDFASTNQTLVNGTPVTEQQLFAGDMIEIGNQVFRVIRGTMDGDPAPDVEAPPATASAAVQATDKSSAPPPAAPSFDLGFKSSSTPTFTKGQKRSAVLKLAWTLAGLLLVVASAILALRFAGGEPEEVIPSQPPVPPLTVLYEKIEGDPENIFRYALRIEDDELHIQIDDIKNQRHVYREKELDREIVDGLTEALQASQFSALQNDYSGVSPGVHNLSDITVIIGRKAHRVRVLNRVEPEDFRRVQDLIEEFGRVELGLAALAMTPERLRELAQNAYLEGRKRYEERDVRYENLSESVRQFTLAQWYLETIEPKPAFYPAILQGQEQSMSELNDRYSDYLFRAERAIKLKDWEEAASNLRVIMELIPDRSDERHQKTENQLLIVERYLRRR